MSNIGTQIVQLRKGKNWSQEDLAKQVDASRIMIGNYERGDNIPSIDVVIRIAKALDVSIDYLVGEGKHASFDKETIKRLRGIEDLDVETKMTLFRGIDTFLRDARARSAYS